MTKAQFDTLKKWIADMASLIEKNIDPEPEHFISFLNEPELALEMIQLIDSLDDEDTDEERPYYSSCIFAIDICVAQLQSAVEAGNKLAGKTLNQLMSNMAKAINSGKHSLSFWLPVLNAFYDVHVELSDELRDAYLELAGQDEELTFDDEIDHLEAMRSMIAELSDLSHFDIAENFFAQSHAMPADFFPDLIVDLYSIEEGQDIALLALLHPKPEVREMVIATLEQLMDTIVLSSVSLSRLQIIQSWYPALYQSQFSRWIKLQRMKGVVFNKSKAAPIVQIKASEVDGSGAQGLFIHIKQGRNNRLCGLLYKFGLGIKDAWVTPPMSVADVKKYYNDAFDESVTLREVDTEYLVLITEHFLAITIKQGSMPDLHLLEMQELMGIHFAPNPLDINATIQSLSIQITPFTQETMELSFKRSKSWLNNKRFTESWYIENAHVDKLVNRCSSFVEGVKVCVIEDAINEVFTHEMELHRDKWLFHFLWITLWLKAHTRKNEKIWQDSFFIAYAIHTKRPLKSIPVLQEISHQTVINSIETMNERRTHLNQE
ncbi:MAG: hypothetical protein Q8M03_15020 [Legionella sp.]|nr:hypothetical protein [Legionella sp.]